MKRVALLGLLTLVVAAGAGTSPARTVGGDGLTLSLPKGWYALVGGGVVQAADFPLPRRARLSESLARVPRGKVHLMISNGGPWVPYLPNFRPTRAPLVLGRRDLLPGGMEGFAGNDRFARLDAKVDGDMIDVLADLGPKPHLASALRTANAVLATLGVPPPRVLRARIGRLAADGVAVRLPPGWSGRMEIPPDRYGARLVLRAAHGDVHLTLLELTGAPAGDHLGLPIVLEQRNVLLHSSPPLARRVFSTGGRSFDLSVTVPAAGDLQAANRFLATLRVAPRSWTFHSCDLTLRVPGTWRVAVRPRNGCYPVLKLRGPGVLVALTELRAGEQASGIVLQRSGRRFQVAVIPASARPRANAVLATLRADPRS